MYVFSALIFFFFLSWSQSEYIVHVCEFSELMQAVIRDRDQFWLNRYKPERKNGDYDHGGKETERFVKNFGNSDSVGV